VTLIRGGSRPSGASYCPFGAIVRVPIEIRANHRREPGSSIERTGQLRMFLGVKVSDGDRSSARVSPLNAVEPQDLATCESAC
jgi:hypothetical protein